jgi:hypothetical protein
MTPSGIEPASSKHVEDSNKHIVKEVVRQVVYLPQLYGDAQSQKYKIL